MNNVEALIQDCDSDGKYAALQEYIDIDSFVDMYLINAITNDIDSNIASTFYYKKEAADDQKLYAGPAWDYDNAWGRMDNQLGYELNAYPTGLCEELFLNDRFREAVTEKYNDVAYPLMQDYLTTKIPQYLEQIASSIAMDSVRWQSDGYHSYYYTDYEAAVSYLEAYISERMDYLYSWLNHPEEYRRVLFVNATSNHKYRDTEYMIKDGEQIPDEVLAEILSRFEGSDFQNEDGSPFAPETAILDDIILSVK
jgi:hypothetical protein